MIKPSEIDAAIAEKVMGLHVHNWVWDLKTRNTWECSSCHRRKPGGQTGNPPAYSADIKAAWDVVTILSSRFHWRITSPFESGQLWFAGLTPLRVSGWYGVPDILVSAESAPMAISLAALEAVGSGQSEWQRPAHGLGE